MISDPSGPFQLGALKSRAATCNRTLSLGRSGSMDFSIRSVVRYDSDMRLLDVEYSEYSGEERQWAFERVSFGPVNLIVGRNATGKSRVIQVINNLSKLLMNKHPGKIVSGDFDLNFAEASTNYHYHVKYNHFFIEMECLDQDGVNKLRRQKGGTGEIHAEQFDQPMKFEIAGDMLAAMAKRDAIQHPFLEPLHRWAASVRCFQFGTRSGGGSLAFPMKNAQVTQDDSDTNQVIGAIHNAIVKYGKPFKDAVINDMNDLGYHIDDIKIDKASNIEIVPPVIADGLYGIAVMEHDLNGWTEQHYMSQGMFRALSTLAQIEAFIFAGSAATILIDDIGEGLDYERSCLLIGLLRKKAQDTGIQLIMSTNDRFVMNSVPLEEWCVLERKGQRVKGYNYANSQSAFEEFKFTGLSNFDLLATDYIPKVMGNGEDGDLRRGPDGEATDRPDDRGDCGDQEVPH